MRYLKINKKNIFPMIGTVNIMSKDKKVISTMDLPRGANLLYLQSINNKEEGDLLSKYCESEKFTDRELKTIFKYFITQTPRKVIPNSQCDWLNFFGIEAIGTFEKVNLN